MQFQNCSVIIYYFQIFIELKKIFIYSMSALEYSAVQ